MNSSRAATIVNHNRRIWLRSGKVEQSAVTEPNPIPTVKWGAAVYDSTTGEQLSEYPYFTGEAPAPNGDYEHDEVVSQYVERCRFADGKPNIELLMDKVQMNVWQINIEELADTPVNH